MNLFLKGMDMRKVINLGIIIVTTILPVILALYVIKDEANTFVWSLYIIPKFFILMYSSKWITAIITNLVYTILEITSQHYFLASEESQDMLLVLVFIPIVNLIIFFILAYFRIKLKRINDKLIDIVVHDHLTGIYNRRYFDISMEKSISAYIKSKISFQIILFDIDHFKVINDTYGHPCGDYILKELTNLINDEIRSQDIFTRNGGEEFAIILPETNIENGEEIAHRIRKIIEEFPFQYKNTIIQVTISIGLATYQGESMDELMDRADSALYKAKTNGRNQIIMAEY